MQAATTLRDPERREKRLDDEWLHLFSLEEMVRALRSEGVYESSGQSGVLLLRTPRLRVLLEVARKGSEIGRHSVPGSTAVQVLHGELRLESEGDQRVARAGELAVVPQDRTRRLVAEEDAAFLWILSLEEDEPD